MEHNATYYMSVDNKNYPNLSLSFEVNEDLDIYELGDLFVRFASALGYTEDTIEKILNVEAIWNHYADRTNG